ncbi:MAG: ATP:cob(I)alamin adenosyltransferase, partial [Bdellovibrionota bacterium]
MKIYTKTGDSGSTGLYSGKRVQKDHLRIQAYGALDELNAALGFATSLMNAADLS